MKKMNNKGFSLVELIVVVLIMAIIAVALAPQVMRWVENSRKSNDIEEYNAYYEAANIAATDEGLLQSLDLEDYDETIVTMTANSVSIDDAWSAAITRTVSSGKGITSGEWSGKTFTISAKMTENGMQIYKGNKTAAVAGTNYPEKDFS